MQFPRFQLHSLKTRLTLLNLLIVIVSIWLLAYYAKGLLKDELVRFTGEQQRSALSLLTTEVKLGLQDRLDGLNVVASQLKPAVLTEPTSLAAFVKDQAFLLKLFNGGLQVWHPSGEVVAEVAQLAGQPALQTLNPQELARVLKQGRSVIGGIQRDDSGSGRFAMAVPIRNAQGAVIGALGGVVRLDQTSFLRRLTAHPYGQTGNFFLIEPRQRLIFATSDQARLMEVLPAPGVSPWIDRFMQGFEGTAQVLNPHGVEVLVSIAQIPMAGWYASVTLSSGEASGLIQAVAPRARLVGLGLVLMCVALIWLMLRHQLAPMMAAAKTLDGFVRQNQAPQALQVVRQDEVGQLVGGFNRLLDTLTQQQQVLQQSELFKQAVLNSMTAEIAVLDHTGVILEVNNAWRRHASARDPRCEPVGGVGLNYLTLCQQAVACDGIRAVIDGREPHFHLEYACQTPGPQRWCSISVTPLEGTSLRGAVVSIEDITVRVQMQNQVRELAFYDPLTHLPNRRLVLDRLSLEMGRARRAKSALALLFIDLDSFKPINDALGHAVGDWLLQSVAERIQACLRESDTAARLGGDEFVVLLPDLQNVEAALAVAEKIRHELTQAFVTAQGIVLNISSSIGVALYPDHAATEKDLLRLGDEAMYKAKKAGRNAVMLCTPVVSERPAVLAGVSPLKLVHLHWKAAFGCGQAQIDREHQALFEMANGLLDRAAQRYTHPTEFDAAFELLMAHVENHFAHEEALLQAQGFTHLAAHIQLHHDLVDQAHMLHHTMQGADAGSDAEAALIKFLVSDLVAGHMLQADRVFSGLWPKPPDGSVT